MTVTQQHTNVLIVGAGPSGLMMAAQLLRYGVQPVIIDSKQGPTTHSKALAVQARSLEIYRQMGILEGIINGGKPAGEVVFNEDGSPVAHISLADTGQEQTAFPYVFLYQQSKNERQLLDFLTLNCCPVYWDTTVTSLQQINGKVTATLQTGGDTQTLTADYLIGADGAHSSVRHFLQIPFTGDTYNHEFYLADVKLGNDLGDRVNLFLAKKGFAAFFPMPEDQNFRIVGQLPAELSGNDNVQPEDVLPQLNAVAGQNINIEHTNWFTTYRLHCRMADVFSKGNCFLIGDAAHIHSPVGGQGMNTGLQDAYNLAWKLAGVVNHQLKPQILDSYAAERMPVAKTLLNTTDKAFKLILSKSWLARLFKKWMLPRIIRTIGSKPAYREELFKRISQTGISYRESKLSLNLSHYSPIKAGDRLPYLKVFDEKKQEETDLHEWCGKPGFTMLTLGKLQEIDLFTLAKWITQTYPGNLNFFYLPYSVRNQLVFDAFGIHENQKLALIIRPDMHIGFVNDAVDIDMMDNYLQNVVGVTKA